MGFFIISFPLLMNSFFVPVDRAMQKTSSMGEHLDPTRSGQLASLWVPLECFLEDKCN